MTETRSTISSARRHAGSYIGAVSAGGPSRSFFSLPDIGKLAKFAASAADAVTSTPGEGEVQTDGDRQTYHSRKILPFVLFFPDESATQSERLIGQILSRTAV
jgi:hypothetical protein